MDYSLQPVPHVNLMMDTFIANSNVEDLRAVVRALLVSGPPNTSPASSTAGSPRLSSTSDLASSIPDADPIFSPQAHDLLTRARALFGAGLGLESLPLLTVLIRGTSTLRWSEDGGFVDSLAVLDGDISQAIQSATEEITQQVLALQLALSDLRAALKSCESEVVSWGGEFPFERGMLNVDWLEQSDLWIKNMVIVA
ncbi:hypothetical protein DL93DRAFT_2061848 [Clavulina sp. PMI_390]|nr:hypothetical protein DL93DRAFT_2061848 [Clavulina sp. PMI_390]